ncbi:glycosyltransferase [Microbacterium aurantiacum]|uniref:glycosyltransferase n=1 Tax=Microbacterium aurantiacum TaxID=162393 RepID=UPI001FE70177|nr:glycosyltransferase [Microbacterium aurantiacum]
MGVEEDVATSSASASSVFPDAEYLVLSSRLIPDLDGGYTIATLARAKQMAEAGVADGRGPQLLTFDPGAAEAHAEHREAFAERGALADVKRMRNLFDEARAPEGGAAEWLLATAEQGARARTDREYRVLLDAEQRPFAALPVIAGDPDWHLTDESVLVYDAAGEIAGGLTGFRGLYRAWLDHVAASLGDRPIVVICESRQIGELIADWAVPRVRIIHTIHTMHVEPPYTPDAPLNALWSRWFAIAERFDAVVWPTPTQRDDVVRRFEGAATHHVVPNGVRAPRSPVAERVPGLVVVLGRLAAGKRVDHAIRAFLRADVPQTRLEIWGDGPERMRLQQLIEELDAGERVHLAGFAADPAPALDRASVVLTATAFEGQGLSIVEALAHGSPAVSYDVRYGPGDILGAGGGVLVPDGDEDALATALRGLLSDPATWERLHDQTGTAAAAWSPEAAMDALAGVARDVLEAPARR